MSAPVTSGGRHTAAYRDTWSLTAAARARGAYEAASVQVASSPVTRMTGTPNSSATRALRRPSPASTPSTRTSVIEFGR